MSHQRMSQEQADFKRVLTSGRRGQPLEGGGQPLASIKKVMGFTGNLFWFIDALS